MTTITKQGIAIVTLTSQKARDWMEEYATAYFIDANSFVIDRIFLAELIEAMTEDDLIEDTDYEITYK